MGKHFLAVIFLLAFTLGCASCPPLMNKNSREPITGMEFVWVPGGCFEMGQAETEKWQIIKRMGEAKYMIGALDELPRHRVCLDGFWMGKTEVTNAQYRRFKAGHDSKTYRGHSLNGEDQPVVYVSWEDARAFAKWLSE